MENNTLCNRHSLGVNNHTKMYVTYTRIYGWSDYGGESSYQPGYRLENMMWMTLLVYDYIIPGRWYSMVTVNNYYNNIPVGRDLNNLPNTSSTGTTVGYQYDGLTEEDRFVQKVLQEHYDKVYKENLSHSDPMAYIESKYCDVTSPNFCSYMTEDQRSIAYRNEKRME